MNVNNWTARIKRARQVEKEILLWYRKHHDPNAQLTEGYNADCDIVSSKDSIEVKEDRLAHQTGYYALEYETHDGKPSGYAGTKASIFCLVDWEYVCLINTWLLKDIINSMEFKKSVNMGQMFSDGKTNKGWLIPREKIFNNGGVTVLERWFPITKG